MKIQCDVCDKDEASVFCVADEAALCGACDHRVHHANKLAGKHQRFSLQHSSPTQVPLCDICKERRAFLFCQQDRAILCRECDIPIHKANEHTQKHTRFLLTGVKLSPTCALYSASQHSKHKHLLASPQTNTPSTSKSTSTDLASPESQCINGGNFINSSGSGNSISEYLIDMLPGWHVEDFLDSSSFPSPNGFCKNGDNDVMPLWDADLESNMNAFSTEKMGFWVPQAPPCLNQTQNQSMDLAFGTPNLTKDNIKSSRKWSEDSSFLVPQITPPSSASKRLRNFW